MAESPTGLKRQAYQNVSSVENLDSSKVEGESLISNNQDSDATENSSSEYPIRIQCSNDCGKVLESKSELERHIDADCPLTIVDCNFKHVGCEVRLPRRALPTHLTQAVVLHLSQQAEKYEERMKMLEADNERLAIKCKRLETAHKELEEKVSGVVYAFKRLVSNAKQGSLTNESIDINDVEHLRYLNADVVRDLPTYSTLLHTHIMNHSPSSTSGSVSLTSANRTPVSSVARNSPRPSRSGAEFNGRYINADAIQEHQRNGNYSYILTSKSQSNSPSSAANPRLLSPIKLTMTSFEQHKRNDDNWISQPFYTHAKGYKMCLRVTANGQSSGKGTHITVAVYLMKGEFDDQLEWPFRGDITIQLLSQQGSGGHFTRTIHRAKGERSEAAAGEKFISAWCISQFKSHRELIPDYLKDDSLIFHITTTVRQLEPLQQLIETEV